MSVKKNFYQALNELLGKDNQSGSEPEEKTDGAESDSSFEAPQAVSDQKQAVSIGKEAGAQSAASSSGSGGIVSYSTWRKPFQRESPPPEQPAESFSAQGAFRQVNEMTVISKNTHIVGDIRSLASVTIDGTIRGKVDVLKDATVQGMLVGDLTCKSARMLGSSIQGSVLTKEAVYIDHNSIILGDLTAQHASIDGKIKGNIEICGKAEFLENAIISGDIHAGTIAIAGGANIKGFVSTSYLKENNDSAFPGEVIINEDDMLSVE